MVHPRWVSIETYGQAKHQWLQQFLELPNGIPSHDTQCPEYLQDLIRSSFNLVFARWVKSVSKITEGEVIAIDGKTLRHSYDKGADKGAIH